MKSLQLRKNFWFWIAGFAAFLWFILRSGTNPKRLAYPCQRVAFPMASAFLIAFISLFAGTLLVKRLLKFSWVATLIIFLAFCMVSSTTKTNAVKYLGALPEWTVNLPTSAIFVSDTIYPSPGSLAAGDNSVPDAYLIDPAMDSIFNVADSRGLHLYKTAQNPEGIVGKDDIVIIKGNYQWPGHLGTNTDRVKGFISLVLRHPDSFSGEIIVADNTQYYGDITDNSNNSDDPDQSIIDVVNTFSAKGFPVYISHWTDFKEDICSEYDKGDSTDGYVIDTKTLINYPKFKSPSGKTYISLKNGIWNPVNSTFNKGRLTIIDFPILKAHCMAGATIAMKNWIGVVTMSNYMQSLGGDWDTLHYKYLWGEYALLARVMALTMPKLSVVDATYVSTVNNYDSDEGSNPVVKTGKLIVSTDPLAVDWYSARFVLTPVAANPERTNPDILNIYTPPNECFGPILRRWAKVLIDTMGFSFTIDSSKISVYKTMNAANVKINKITQEPGTIVIYPNPANNLIFFNTSRKIKNIVIYSSEGKMVLLKENIQGSLNISMLKQGIYFVNLLTHDGKQYKTRFCKR
jgi:hypothetical protein